MNQSTSRPLVSDQVYVALRKLVEYILPALGAFYFTLAQIWGFPAAEEVVGTIAAVTVLFAAFLSLSRKRYNESDAMYDGRFVVNTTDPEKDVFRLDVDKDFEEMAVADEVKLKVVNESEPTG